LVDPAARIVIAHRGASAEQPENTLAAFGRAVELGAHAIELDVRLSRDGVPVVAHDETLDRVSPERGRVADLTAAQLARVPVGSTVGVPALGDVLAAIDLPLLIEIKEVDAQDEVAGVVLRAAAAPRVVLASEHDDALAAFRRPPFLVGASARDILRLWLAPVRGLPEPRVTAYSVPHRHKGILTVPTRRFIRDAHALGATVHVWTVDHPATASRLLRRGANGIITNHPRRMLAALR
jgi:glycerophosphoryl diester phosphodiesterase